MRPFDLHRVGTIQDATAQLSLAGANGDVEAPAQLLAGGTNLLDLMKLDVMRPERLIDIGPLGVELGTIRLDETGLHLGALVRMAEAAAHPAVSHHYPVIADSLLLAASPQLRNMATLAGNLLQKTRCNYFRDTSWSACNKRSPGSGCTARGGVTRRLAVLGTSDRCIANYPGDFANALIILDAELEVCGADAGSRWISVESLHRIPGDTPHIDTTLRTGEMITRIRVPLAPWCRRSRYVKVRDRASYDFALASAAVAMDLEKDRRVRQCRIAVGGLATVPWRCRNAETFLNGKVTSEASAREAAEIVFAEAETDADRGFKIELGKRTLLRTLFETAEMELPA